MRAKSSPIRVLYLLFHVVLIAGFGLWFGGFTFYTAFVVPIGTDVLGSSRTQGFITQQVTDVMNLVGMMVFLWMAVDSALNWSLRTSRENRLLLGSTLLMGVLLFVLFRTHHALDSMLEPEHEYVTDEARFYQMHRIYLWVSTVQWILGWVWLITWCRFMLRCSEAGRRRPPTG